MEISTIGIISTLLLSVIITALAFFLSKRLKKRSYDNIENKATLESLRNALEKQMYIINDRLIQNEERWKDVNHLLLQNDYKNNNTPISNSRQTYYSDFLKANGIEENDLLIDNKLIFVITPFNDKFYDDYQTIREVCKSLGFNCLRGDETYFKGDIFPEILKLITKSNLIIANINGRNANVMYELGIAQAMDKPVLLVSKDPGSLPIDIKSKRFLIYSDYKELKDLIRAELLNIS